MHIIGLRILKFFTMSNPKQLTFPWSKPNKSSFSEFYFDQSNLAAKDALLADDDLFLYGINQTGKSFLLQSACNYFASIEKSSLYIPVKEVKKHGPDLIDSLDQLKLICIDDVDLISSEEEWEIALFNLINNCFTSNCRIIFSSSTNPSKINFKLKDLISRIKKIDHVELMPVKTDNLPEAIKFIANLRSINLGDKEIKYLVTYSKRSMSSLLDVINNLDNLSMRLKRKITIPLIKEII